MALKVLKDFWIGRTNYKPGQSYAGGDVQELLNKGLIVVEPDQSELSKPDAPLESPASVEPEPHVVEPQKKVKKKKG